MQGETVILVHGLWMNGLEMSLLSRRLQRQGYATRRFSYPSMRQAPLENARLLQVWLAGLDSPIQHFVCHSLGGLIVRHLFHLYPERKPGKIVTLGTPHASSEAARRLQQYRLGKLFLGKSTELGLASESPAWNDQHALGRGIPGINMPIPRRKVPAMLPNAC